MPAARIIEILEEIGALSNNDRVKALALELGTLLATSADHAHSAHTRVTRLQDNTTRAIVDTEATLEDHIIGLRTAIQGLSQLFRRHIDKVEERNEAITGRVHTLANHVNAVELKVGELAEIVTDLVAQTENVFTNIALANDSGTAVANDDNNDPNATDRSDATS